MEEQCEGHVGEIQGGLHVPTIIEPALGYLIHSTSLRGSWEQVSGLACTWSQTVTGSVLD